MWPFLRLIRGGNLIQLGCQACSLSPCMESPMRRRDGLDRVFDGDAAGGVCDAVP